MTQPAEGRRYGVYPGTFNPPTVGHLAIIEAALEHLELARLDLVVSIDPLAKTVAQQPRLPHRIEVIEASVAHLPRVEVRTTSLRLIADISGPYDVVVMGADKWVQVNDISFYESQTHRDELVASLPQVAVAARAGDHVPEHLLLPTDTDIHHVSSSDARAGAHHLMTAAAKHFDSQWSAWSNPDRYETLLR